MWGSDQIPMGISAPLDDRAWRDEMSRGALPGLSRKRCADNHLGRTARACLYLVFPSCLPSLPAKRREEPTPGAPSRFLEALRVRHSSPIVCDKRVNQRPSNPQQIAILSGTSSSLSMLSKVRIQCLQDVIPTTENCAFWTAGGLDVRSD